MAWLEEEKEDSKQASRLKQGEVGRMDEEARRTIQRGASDWPKGVYCLGQACGLGTVRAKNCWGSHPDALGSAVPWWGQVQGQSGNLHERVRYRPSPAEKSFFFPVLAPDQARQKSTSARQILDSPAHHQRRTHRWREDGYIELS
ncbi:hypothetical protein IF2G_05972 [Cordyceps javanica]|nr:hypothetical protein IF2G_05972 [Cordyceps javanica]